MAQPALELGWPSEVSTSSVKQQINRKERAWANSTENRAQLNLLDLPVDVLQAILKEITHTNDLTSLALTHSSLHDLVIPHIYQRFDIVWPEANPTVESRIGVDALTYGLATLVMAHDVFGEAPYQQQTSQSYKSAHQNDAASISSHPSSLRSRRFPRRGNHFAQYTRKFSLGNGPTDWVQEYMITKEGGKMLGTLVALAVGRMRNLEAFIWDMPTGVVRDIWLALASLANRADGEVCRLQKVSVRWHDNRDAAPLGSLPPSGTAAMHHASALPLMLPAPTTSMFYIPPYPAVEFPTFSILPPLKSLSVLDIDEVPYVEEISILLERSLNCIQELRIGVAQHAQHDISFRPVEDRSVVLPPFMSGDERARPGGLLGILFNRFCTAFSTSKHASGPSPEVLENVNESKAVKQSAEPEQNETADPTDINQLGVLLSAQSIEDDLQSDISNSAGFSADILPAVDTINSLRKSSRSSTAFQQSAKDVSNRKLKVETLELERVCLSIAVMSQAVDWSGLQSLTLLGCRNHDQLWKALRRTFTPPVRSKTLSGPTSNSHSFRPRATSSSHMTINASEYKLNIRRLHTDTVSAALLAFIKDTLAPDTLEWLFLQETVTYQSLVSMDQIYRSAIRRHRLSLKKLLIDSELRVSDEQQRDREPSDTNWRRWICNREVLTCITSGKMQLRELSMSIDYKDWHFLLQRLPGAIELRSLHVAHIAEHPYGRSCEPREIALQVLDIISLRPEIQLCYLGVERKCFEIVEYCSTTTGSKNSLQSHFDTPGPGGATTYSTANGLGLADDTDGEETSITDPNDHGHHVNGAAGSDLDNSDDGAGNFGGFDNRSDIDEYGDPDDDDDYDEEEGAEGDKNIAKKLMFKLREILFYDDKISIFRARHGKL